jgi:GDP/UDP-N,N'-diacetylbacillosamine 2-epimerase (hydrolysing)
VSRKICVVSGSRAEYGLLRWVMEAIRAAPDLRLQLIVTGTHLSPEFGLTYREIERDGFHIDRQVEMLLSSDTAVGIAKSMGLGLIGFGEALQQLQPDLLLVLGDRFEIFSAAAAALVVKIPVAHLHGGETTEGAFDEALRHSITKMAQLHFVAAEEYRRRVVQLGENPKHVFLVGGLGIDSIKRLPLLDRPTLETELGFRFGEKNLLVTFHPATLDDVACEQQLAELLAALDQWPHTHVIFTLPNADTHGRALSATIEQYAAARANAHAYVSLGQTRYLSCVSQVDAVVGNSSSGLTEAPTFRIGTINIGDRQRGRLKAASVIDCKPERTSIGAALEQLYSPAFRAKLAGVRNPYGEGGASERVVAVLRTHALDGILKKSFHDLV